MDLKDSAHKTARNLWIHLVKQMFTLSKLAQTQTHMKDRKSFLEQHCGLGFNSPDLQISFFTDTELLGFIGVPPHCTRLEKVHSNSTNIQNSFTKFSCVFFFSFFCIFFLVKYIWTLTLVWCPTIAKNWFQVKCIQSYLHKEHLIKVHWRESWLTVMSLSDE